MTIDRRITNIDWSEVGRRLDAEGCAVVQGLVLPVEALGLTEGYGRAELFRSRVIMSRHGFGKGEYQYFRYPLPALVAELRTALYPRLSSIANRWNQALNIDVRYPVAHVPFLERCHAAGQTEPTPLLLKYEVNDYNCLHQDLYGERVFPLQVAVLLSEPGRDFSGGEFVLTEQRPRMQSRTEGVSLGRG